MLKVLIVALGGRSDQVSVPRGRLAIDDAESVGGREERPREDRERADRNRTLERAVGGIIEEVEPALESRWRIGLIARFSVGSVGRDGTRTEFGGSRRDRGARATQESGHGAGFGHPHRRSVVDEVLDVLRRDQPAMIGIDKRENVMFKQPIDRDIPFDRGDRVAD